jgi:hypothetical protein
LEKRGGKKFKKSYDTLLGHRYWVKSSCMEPFLQRVQSRKNKAEYKASIEKIAKNGYYETEIKTSMRVIIRVVIRNKRNKYLIWIKT